MVLPVLNRWLWGSSVLTQVKEASGQCLHPGSTRRTREDKWHAEILLSLFSCQVSENPFPKLKISYMKGSSDKCCLWYCAHGRPGMQLGTLTLQHWVMVGQNAGRRLTSWGETASSCRPQLQPWAPVGLEWIFLGDINLKKRGEKKNKKMNDTANDYRLISSTSFSNDVSPSNRRIMLPMAGDW